MRTLLDLRWDVNHFTVIGFGVGLCAVLASTSSARVAE